MKSKYFDIRELVPPDVYEERGDKAWELLDPDLLRLLDLIWERCGEFVVNDWHKGGHYKESGFRSAGTSTGSKYSQHKFGRAIDGKPKKGTAREFYEKIKAMIPLMKLGLTLEDIESTPTWVHCDVRNNHLPGIRIVKP